MDKNATQAVREISEVFGDEAVSVRVAQYWFKRFKSRKFYIKDAFRTDRPVIKNIDDIFTEIKLNRHISSYKIAKRLNIDHRSVFNYLRNAGFKKKLCVWIPHNLILKN